MAFDYSKLRGRIKEVFGTQELFANDLGCTEQTLSARLNNKAEWSQGDIKKAALILGIGDNDIPTYFFTPKVQIIEQEG